MQILRKKANILLVFTEPIFCLLQCKRISWNDIKFGWSKLGHCINTAVDRELCVSALPLLGGLASGACLKTGCGQCLIISGGTETHQVCVGTCGRDLADLLSPWQITPFFLEAAKVYSP